MIEMKCPHCAHQMRIESKHAGRRGACKYCHGRFQIPTGEDPVPDSTPDLQPSLVADSSGVHEDAEGLQQDLSASGEHSEDDLQEPGALFWVIAFFVPPAAFIWALLMPRERPHKKAAVLVPAGLMLLTLLISVAFVVVAGTMGSSLPQAVEELDRVSEGTRNTPGPDAGPKLPQGKPGAPLVAALLGEDVPVPAGLLLQPATSYEDLAGPLAEMSEELLACHSGELGESYYDLLDYYENELPERGWSLDITYSFDGTQGRFSTIDAVKEGRALFIKIVETDGGTRVIMITRR